MNLPGIFRALTASALFGLISTGCSMDALTGDMMSNFAVQHITPYTMGTSDLQMGCQNGQATGNMLLAYSRVMDMPHKAAATALMSSGMCSELAAYSEELEYLRHLQAGNGASAQDARIRQQRHHAVTAHRYWRAYQHTVLQYGEPGGSCPALEPGEEALYLTGMSSGVQAFVNDRLGGGDLGVPLGVMNQVSRAMDCLDNASLWGMPHALQAAIWAGIPGGVPEGRDGPGQMKASVAIGEKAGQRMSRVFAVMTARAMGDVEALRQGIREHRASLEETPSNPETIYLDAFATRLVLHQSDLLWMEAKGHRTPTGGLGTFWDDTTDTDGEDDLLDDLEDETTEEEG